MSDPAIRIIGLSKAYHINRSSLPRPTNFAEAVSQRLRNPWPRIERETFWALKDIELEIPRGEVVGVIGRNGAGKSTLLKVLSRITEPTTGRVELFGRVGSLLEVGTGFHPELTGRENIYLNGAILGMRRAEIKKQFEAIVDFAGVEKFLDTPVKRYSSGMYVRLAFAVAAHLNPEILIVDEVLAVGDAEFQKKCLGKMKDVASAGRTVLFVSHNMGAIVDLCHRGIMLSNGSIVADDCAPQIVRSYFEAALQNQQIRSQVSSSNNKHFRFSKIETSDVDGRTQSEFTIREPIGIRLHYSIPEPVQNLEISVRVLRSDGLPVFTSLRSEHDPQLLQRAYHGDYQTTLTIPKRLLMPGDYYLNVAAHPPMGAVLDQVEAACQFSIIDAGSAFEKYQNYPSIGVVMQTLQWRETRLDVSESEGSSRLSVIGDA